MLKAVILKMYKIVTQVRECIINICNREKLNQSMDMNVYGFKITGQGHMIQGYQSLDQQNFFKKLESTIEFVKKHKKRNTVQIIDAGANLGFYSIVYSLVGGTNVLSFEPSPCTYQYLERNISFNSINNIIPVKMGLFSKNGEKKIGQPNPFKSYGFLDKYIKILDKEHSGCQTVYTSKKSSPVAEFIKGDCCTHIQKLSHIDFIKIDVEGSELHALIGMQNTINKHLPVLQIEFNSNQPSSSGISLESLWNYIIKLGYNRYIKDGELDIQNTINWSTMDTFPEISGSQDYLFID